MKENFKQHHSKLQRDFNCFFFHSYHPHRVLHIRWKICWKNYPPHFKRTHLFYSTTLYLIEQPAAAKSHQMCIHTQHKIFHFIPPPPVFLSLYIWWIIDRPFFPPYPDRLLFKYISPLKRKKYFCIDILFQHHYGFFQSGF